MARRKSRRRARRPVRSTRRRRRAPVLRIGRRRYRRKGTARVVRRSRTTGRRYTRRVRTYRRNPGLVGGLMHGIKSGLAVSGGVIVYNGLQRYVGGMIPLPATLGAAGDAIKGGLLATLGAYAVGKVIRGPSGALVVAGIWSGFINGLLRSFNVPVVSGLLGEYDVPSNTLDTMGVYPRVAAGVGSYPTTAATQMAYAGNG